MTSPAVSQWLFLLHVLAAIWLAAGSFAGAVVRAQTRRAPTFAEKAFGLRLAWRLAAVFIVPGSIVAGVVGIALVPARGFHFAQIWVNVSMLLWFLMLVIGVFVLAPRAWRLSRAVQAAQGPSHIRMEPTAELQRLMAAKWPGILADINALGIVILVALMVLKPF
jgi:uncharacterized membrane protein